MLYWLWFGVSGLYHPHICRVAWQPVHAFLHLTMVTMHYGEVIALPALTKLRLAVEPGWQFPGHVIAKCYHVAWGFP